MTAPDEKITWDTLPKRSWPEGTQPTPEQIAEWMASLSRDELVWYLGQHQWMWERQLECFVRDHERRIERLTADVRRLSSIPESAAVEVDEDTVRLVAHIIGSQDTLALVEPRDGDDPATTYARAVIAALAPKFAPSWSGAPLYDVIHRALVPLSDHVDDVPAPNDRAVIAGIGVVARHVHAAVSQDVSGRIVEDALVEARASAWEAWEEGAEAAYDHAANQSGPSGIPRDPPLNPYRSTA